MLYTPGEILLGDIVEVKWDDSENTRGIAIGFMLDDDNEVIRQVGVLTLKDLVWVESDQIVSVGKNVFVTLALQ